MSGIIDLSHSICSNIPTYPGDRPIPKVESISKNGITITSIRLGSHMGTHMDAPRHFFPNGKSLGDISPETFIGSAVCLDKSDTQDEINITADELDVLARLRPKWLFIFTGHDKFWGQERYFSNHPYASKIMIRELLKTRIAGIGVDTPSIDAADAGNDGYPNHHLWLGAGRLAIENLCGLYQLPTETVIEIYALPLNIDADGAPVRVLVKL